LFFKFNRETVFKIIRYTLLLLLLLLLQTSVFPPLEVFGSTPNLFVVAVACVAATDGEYSGMVFGLAAGLLWGGVCGTPYMLSGLLWALVAYFGGALITILMKRGFITGMILAVCTALLQQVVCAFYALSIWRGFDMAYFLTRIALPEFVYTLALAPAVYGLVHLFNYRRKQSRKRYKI